MSIDDKAKTLENEADQHFVKMIRLLAEAVDIKCLTHGKLRYMDTKLLKKSIQLLMLYRGIDSMTELAKELKVSTGTITKMMHDKDNRTVNKASIDTLIEYMYETADEYERGIL
ncbi:TPA: hypothetical protein QIX74_001526 [Staphylococcus aureus]|uniref:hypothetical protein n=1 Tax=Staphylococcus aureus TaxID=1280 RepID=UPI000450D29B|nr:hypothetical protein [Staphylococcus aureus]EZV57623.1 hypothetical protein V074_02578 [Staphylococcus aureus 2010-60-1240-1]HDE6300865.1 hypothetical protein [Staphylococcus aureus]HDG4682641.1 hypothetical protein [Staphylococcus aureus]HDG4884425.1 hypothetical protein [Staphylococcus aureus]HEO8862669.1 hypothetical protein [Staphylococcus aureus]